MRQQAGFTLIELLVSVAVFTIIASLILVNFPELMSRLSLSRASREIVLSFRKAEGAALGVSEFKDSGLFPGFGLHFERAAPESYVFFGDLPPASNEIYDGSGEDVEIINIAAGPSIADLCAGQKTAPPGTCGLDWLDVVYTRPGPKVSIRSSAGSFTDAAVIVEGARGNRDSIIIWTTGQISIE